ncbi:MAG: RdgB/HAM1 family non-canonical purine NTP pyrophosphatase [Litorilinea sp.]
MQQLLIATHNPGKVREYRALLADLPLTLLSLDEAGITEDLEETGDTFTANAVLKAEGYAARSGLWTWADDSGLEVDALDGRPGVYSARFGGPGLDDAARYRYLLEQLQAVPDRPRTARFRCVVALALPPHAIQTAQGVLDGEITDTPQGSHGFGYDPIFYLPAQGITLAQAAPALKNKISHRAQAATAAKARLLACLA